MSWLGPGLMAGGAVLGALGADGGDKAPKIPDFMKGALKPYRQDVKFGLEGYNPEFFPGQTYANQSPFTNLAIQGMGGMDTGASQQYLGDVLSGQYLGLSPSMQAAVMNPAIDAVNSRFNQMGQFGSTGNVDSANQAAMQAMMPYYGQERRLQQQASQLLPETEMQQYNAQLRGGGLEESYAQRPIDEAMQRHQFEQEAPYNRLANWSNLYNPILGAPMTQGQSQGSWLSGALGGAMMGASLGNSFGLLGNPAGQAATTNPNYGYDPTPYQMNDPYAFNQWGIY